MGLIKLFYCAGTQRTAIWDVKPLMAKCTIVVMSSRLVVELKLCTVKTLLLSSFYTELNYIIYTNQWKSPLCFPRDILRILDFWYLNWWILIGGRH